MAVTGGGSGWIALASATDSAPTVWTSADGFTWQQGATLPLPAEYRSDQVAAMTAFGTEVYGVGEAWGGPATTGESPSSIIWRSKDGGAWEVIGSGELFSLGPCPAGCASASSIAASASGVVLAGYRVKPVGSRFELETDLWSTQDGTAWVRVPAPVRAGSSDRLAPEITVAAGGPGFVAAGSVCDLSGSACRAVTWTSADGRTWAAPGDLPGGKGVSAQQLAIGPAGAVVLGMRCAQAGCDLVAWSSADGVAWEKADLSGAYMQGAAELAIAGDRFLFVTARDAASCASWTSTDGRHWEAEAVRPGLDPDRPLDQILALAGRPGAALAMGRTTGGKESEDGFWVSP